MGLALPFIMRQRARTGRGPCDSSEGSSPAASSRFRFNCCSLDDRCFLLTYAAQRTTGDYLNARGVNTLVCRCPAFRALAM